MAVGHGGFVSYCLVRIYGFLFLDRGKFVGFGWLRNSDFATKMDCIGVSRHAPGNVQRRLPKTGTSADNIFGASASVRWDKFFVPVGMASHLQNGRFRRQVGWTAKGRPVHRLH